MANKELDKLVKAAEELGYERIKDTKNQHPRFKHTETGVIVTTSGTPSDHRSYKNALSKLRRFAK